MPVESNSDFKVHNMPGLLQTVVTIEDGNLPLGQVRDEGWYESVRETFYYLFKFYQDNNLVVRKLISREVDVDQVVLFSEFSRLGQELLRTKAVDKWLASFDRPGSTKKRSDVSYLEKQLAKLR